MRVMFGTLLLGAALLGTAMLGLFSIGKTASAQGLTREQLPAQGPSPRLGLTRANDELPRQIVPAN